MTLTAEFFEIIRGTNPRPQPWQTELFERLWEWKTRNVGCSFTPRQRRGNFMALLSTSWALGANRFYEEWMRSADARAFQPKFLPYQERWFAGHDEASQADTTSVAVSLHRGKSVEILIVDDVRPSAELIAVHEALNRSMGIALCLRKCGKTMLQTELMRAREKMPAPPKLITFDEVAYCPPEKPQPFYQKFLPKRRLM